MLEEIREIAKDYTNCEVNLDTDLRTGLELTSFDLVSIIGEIEEKYEVEITEDDIVNIITVEDLIKFIESKK